MDSCDIGDMVEDRTMSAMSFRQNRIRETEVRVKIIIFKKFHSKGEEMRNMGSRESFYF